MSASFTLSRFRWFVAGMLLVVTLINYTDRLTMSVLVGDIRQSLNLSETDYSQIVSFFLLAYAVMYAGSGYVVDRLGTRMGMAFFVGFWSICQMLHSVALGKWSFAACRFGLGLAEPGSFPAATKAIGEWFPPEQRAIGVGIFNAGSSLGAAVAAPLAAYLGIHYGWRAAFVFTGALGIVWLAVWLVTYRPPAQVMKLEELKTGAKTMAGPNRVNWIKVLTSRAGLMLVLARFLTDPVIYFVIFWLPAYLEKERGFSLAMIGRYGWIPYAFGGFGYVIGGWLSGRLVQAGWSIGKARKMAMTVGVSLLPVAITAPMVPSDGMAIAAMCLVVFGHAIWVANLMTLPTDLFPPGEVATAAGFSGMGGAIGGALANWFTGSIVMHFSYMPIFLCAGLLHPFSMLLVWRFMPERCAEKPVSNIEQAR